MRSAVDNNWDSERSGGDDDDDDDNTKKNCDSLNFRLTAAKMEVTTGKANTHCTNREIDNVKTYKEG